MGVQLQKLRKRYPRASTQKLKQLAKPKALPKAPKDLYKPGGKPRVDLYAGTKPRYAGLPPLVKKADPLVRPKGTAPLTPPQRGIVGKPVTPPRPVVTPKPVSSIPADPLYEQAVSRTNRDLSQQTAQLAYQEGQLRTDYGIDDPTNPYSKAKQMELRYKQSRQGIGTSMAARGQLYSGAIQNAYNANAQSQSQDYDAMTRSYQEGLQGISGQRTSYQTSAADALWQAKYDQTQRALANRPEDPGVPAPVPGLPVQPIKPGTKKAKPKPKAKPKSKLPKAPKDLYDAKGRPKYDLYDAKGRPRYAGLKPKPKKKGK